MSQQIMKVTVRGLLDERWSRWMKSAELTHLESGYTRLSKSYQHSDEIGEMMMSLNDLGLDLVAVEI